jgi:periplasmic protein TonB
MSPHVDILEQPDSLKRPFWYSVIFHVSVAGVLALYAWGPLGNAIRIGSEHPGGGGIGNSVTVKTIVALPSSGGRPNPVANPTESLVPPPPSKAKPQPKVKEPKPNAVALKGEKSKPTRTAAAPRNTFEEKQQYASNQLYHEGGQRLSSPLVGMQGAGVGPGENSPFGTQFGWYATLLQNALAKNWRTAGLGSQGTVAVVSFRILRDGSLAPGLTRVTQPSGNRALDDSAYRAVLDSAPFPALPPGFPHSQADCEFRFEMRH